VVALARVCERVGTLDRRGAPLPTHGAAARPHRCQRGGAAARPLLPPAAGRAGPGARTRMYSRNVWGAAVSSQNARKLSNSQLPNQNAWAVASAAASAIMLDSGTPTCDASSCAGRRGGRARRAPGGSAAGLRGAPGAGRA
jgi:hypothetical protein